MTSLALASGAVRVCRRGALWEAGAGGFSSGLGNRPVTVKTPAWLDAVRGSWRSRWATCWRTVLRNSPLRATSAAARGSARLRRDEPDKTDSDCQETLWPPPAPSPFACR